jgi:hypothetical protein
MREFIRLLKEENARMTMEMPSTHEGSLRSLRKFPGGRLLFDDATLLHQWARRFASSTS